ncbi:uncharacterized protein [Aegilops tauschii subsp. strangulata]|uniref:uncharacterized protein n=1 Tax=Aegilops tauschii subsp. strangulata TaxID=200361 RepID=UPI00098A1481|nr:uncharacterized protein LOC109770524 [Aegilops tauschii subsp. strangulata]
MSPRRRGSSGYRSVCQRPSGAFYAEIRSGAVRLALGTFETPHEAAPRAQSVAPPPRLITYQDREEYHRRRRRLLITKADERAMAEWCQRYQQDVTDENAFWMERTARHRAERAERRRRKALAEAQCDLFNAGGELFFDSDDPHWEDAWLDTSDDTSKNDDEDDLK